MSVLIPLVLAPVISAHHRAFAQPPAAKSLTWALSSDVETFDWNLTTYANSQMITANTMDGLFEADRQGGVRPRLAASTTLSSDRLTLIVKLKPGVKWSDATPLKAAHFVDSWKRLLDPLLKSPYAGLLADVAGAVEYQAGRNPDFSTVGLKALDDATIELHLTRPCPFLTSILALPATYPVRADLIARHGRAWTDPKNLVTLGPFSLASYEKDSLIVLRRNPSYTGPAPRLDEIRLPIVDSDETVRKLFADGKLDVFEPSRLEETQRALPRARSLSFPILRTQYLSFELTRFPTNEKKVREAIGRAIDRSKISSATRAPVQPALSLVPEQLLPEAAEVGLKFDPAAARRALADAGVNPALLPPLELLVLDTDEAARIGAFIQEQLSRNLGLKVTVRPTRKFAFLQTLSTHSHGAVLAGWGADYADAHSFVSAFHSKIGFDDGTWRNERYDRLVEQALGAKDERQRRASYRSALEILLVEDVRLVPLYRSSVALLYQPRVRGLVSRPFGAVSFRELDVD
ncbi:MAG: peptide ABC transporter substrate-binding protein [Deltaproteobacteria bacterium]|nr:peptide ABC transporter substrate-binding protein [Deltaproteobacteria bacterium]